MTFALELKDVRKSFGKTEIIRGASLQVNAGERVAIIGPNGAGKSTLFNLISGRFGLTSGEILLNGQRIDGHKPYEINRRGLARSFQVSNLFNRLSVFENIMLAVDELNPNWTKARKIQLVEKYIAMVNLTPAREKKPHELSGGMRQRVSVARALAMEPQVLLLDEPLSALDALTRATLQDEICRIRSTEGKTVILITNDPDEGI